MDGVAEEYRKFSVDPNITSFEVLQSILCRAFDIQAQDISIAYKTKDHQGRYAAEDFQLTH